MIDLRKWKIGQYLRELSIVIIGVSITFIGTSLIKSHNDKNALVKNLSAVKTELEYNMYDIDVKLSFYESEDLIKNYLRSIKSPSEISKDTIYEYYDYAFSTFSYYYKKDAFDILKLSEGAYQLNDLDLLLEIMESYRCLQFTKESNDLTMAKKNEIIIDTKTNLNELTIDSFIEIFKRKEGARLYQYLRLGVGADAHFKMKVTREQLQKTIKLIEDKLANLTRT